LPGDRAEPAPTSRTAGSAALKTGIYVSLTTIPPRMAGIEACVQSLLDQTVAAEKIFICVPAKYRRFGDPNPLPFDLSRFGDRVELVRPAQDYGPGTKLLGSLDLVPRAPAALLVLVDDDMVYRPHMLATFRDHFAANPGSAASFHTYRYKGLPVGQGADGFALPASRLDGIRDFHRVASECPEAFFVDDLWISYFLWLKRIPIADLKAIAGAEHYIFEHIYNDVQALNREIGTTARRRVMRRTYWHLARRFGWREVARRAFGLPPRSWSGPSTDGRDSGSDRR
jgi:hypothetical protein